MPPCVSSLDHQGAVPRSSVVVGGRQRRFLVLLVLLVLSFSAIPAGAEITLGVVIDSQRLLHSQDDADRFSGRVEQCLGQPVKLRVFPSEQMLGQWIGSYRMVDMGLLGEEFIAAQPAGALFSLTPPPGGDGSSLREILVARADFAARVLPGFAACLVPRQDEPAKAVAQLPAPSQNANQSPAGVVAVEVPPRAGSLTSMREGAEPLADDPERAVQEREALILAVRLNRVEKGDVFALREKSRLLLRIADLTNFGIGQLPAGGEIVDGELYLDLQAIPGLTFILDEVNLILDLSISPERLPETHIDFLAERPPGVLQTSDDSLFLNYGLEHLVEGENLETASTRLTSELGGRHGNFLFLSDGFYLDSQDEHRYVRLATRVIRDDRTTLQRYTFGDLDVYPGTFGSRISLAGVGLSKEYAIDPYRTEQPMFEFSGLAPLPSVVEIFQNGRKVRSETIDPGRFSILNLRDTIGAGVAEVVVRDALGREVHYLSPYYISADLLRAGLHDYRYGVGALRKHFGEASADYGNPVWSLQHRYGLFDDLTLSAQSEGGDGLATLGGGVLLRLGAFGVAALNILGSDGRGDSGMAAGAAYEYQGRHWQVRFQTETYSPRFANLADRELGALLAGNLSASLGFIDRRSGSITLTANRQDRRDNTDQEAFIVGYSKSIGPKIFFNASFTSQRKPERAEELSIGFNYYFGGANPTSFSAGYRRQESGDSQELELRQDAPIGIGSGWRISAVRTGGGDGSSREVNPSARYNGRYGIYRADYSYLDRPASQPSQQRFSVSAAGSIVHLGGETGWLRPVQDSFGLVKAGEIENVRVYVNNQEIGRTGSGGILLVPELNSYFTNQVRLENKDVPMEFLVDNLRKDISPPLHSGSCVAFPMRRYQSFSGVLRLIAGEQTVDPAYRDITLAAYGWTAHAVADADGAFYLENSDMSDVSSRSGCEAITQATPASVASGTVRLTALADGLVYVCPVKIPDSWELFTDLGEVECRAQ